MTTTTTTTSGPELSRSEAAEALFEVLTEEPQSLVSLARQIGYRDGPDGRPETNQTIAGLEILATQGRAKRIPNTAGSKQGGWVLATSGLSPLAEGTPEEVVFEWPFRTLTWVPLGSCFVDKTYQRPLTRLAGKIQAEFDPYLFQVMLVSDRGAKNKPARFAVIDGQTRMYAARNRQIAEAPAIVLQNLTRADEADIFWRIQKFRVGMLSWFRFRAQLEAGDEKSIAIKRLVEEVGYEIGEGKDKISAVSALERAYAIDPNELERALIIFKEGWPERIPEGKHINGMVYFLRHFPVDIKNERRDVDDERIVRRLKTNTPNDLEKKFGAAKELAGDKKPSVYRLMAAAIQAAYLSR